VADDVQLTEFDLFTEVLATHSESGGNMPALLDRLAASMRDRNQFRGYFRAVTALGRATAIFLALAGPFGVLLYLVFQPELFARFLDAPEGRQITLVAAVLEVIGLVWLFFLLRRRDEY
jgi:tight adherence protein B